MDFQFNFLRLYWIRGNFYLCWRHVTNSISNGDMIKFVSLLETCYKLCLYWDMLQFMSLVETCGNFYFCWRLDSFYICWKHVTNSISTLDTRQFVNNGDIWQFLYLLEICDKLYFFWRHVVVSVLLETLAIFISSGDMWQILFLLETCGSFCLAGDIGNFYICWRHMTNCLY
jgi:hypothetical protein